MANIFNDARKNIKFLASAMRGLIDLDEVLGEAGSLEKAISGLKADRAVLETQRISVLAAIDEANRTASDIVQKAQDQAAGIEAEAQRVKTAADIRAAEVGSIIATAQSEAAALVDAGHREARTAAADAEGTLGGLRKEIDAHDARKAALLGDIDGLNRTKAEAQAALEALRSKFG